jgi:CheY-like chemotaxis protein
MERPAGIVPLLSLKCLYYEKEYSMTSNNLSDLSFHSPRVLIIEENPLIQQMIHSMFQLLGTTSVVTSQPADALELFHEGFDLVLLDLYFTHSIPKGSSGFEWAQRMRATETQGIYTPIIGHATVANPEEVEPLCIAAGMDALTPKLTCVDAVYRILERWVSCPLVMPVHLLDIYVPSSEAAA